MNIKIYIGLTTKDGEIINSAEAIADLVKLIPFEGYTIYQAKRVYKGTLENTLIVESYINNSGLEYAKNTARVLRNCFEQECVMLTTDNQIYFI